MEKPRIVLIADDDAGIRTVLGMAIRTSDRSFEIVEAATGDEAIARVSGDLRGELYAVLTDYSMPPGRKTGVDVVRVASEAGVSKIAIMTGGHADHLNMSELEAFRARFFPKSFGVQDVLSWLSAQEEEL